MIQIIILYFYLHKSRESQTGIGEDALISDSIVNVVPVNSVVIPREIPFFWNVWWPSGMGDR